MNKKEKINSSCWEPAKPSAGNVDPGEEVHLDSNENFEANCLICGNKLEYYEKEVSLKCFYCGKTFYGYVSCPNGHTVCEQCHNKPIIELTKKIYLSSKSINPFEIFNSILNSANITMLGCHHAFMVAGALIASIKNSGKIKISKENVDEIFNRIERQAISGFCGLTGVSGIEPAIGACFALIFGSKCGTDREQKITMDITSTISRAIFELTGPSCCRAYSWKALEIAKNFSKKYLNIKLEGADKNIRCTYFNIHPHGCRFEKCLYYKK